MGRMPADRLIPESEGQPAGNVCRPVDQQTVEAEATVPTLEPAVLAVLAGTPPQLAAAGTSIAVTELIDAAERYQAAGRAALASCAADDGWHQVHLEFPDRRTAEHTVAAALGPTLRHAEASGDVASWWYIRKTPYWRLRVRTVRPHRAALPLVVTDALDELTSHGLVTTWSTGTYEPETHAFGGPDGMAVAHRFFHADSANILDHISPTGSGTDPRPALLGRRELSLLLCATLLRAAGLDWHEQGDVWHRVTRMRLLDPDTPREPLRSMAAKVHRLLELDTDRAATPIDPQDPLTSARPWLRVASDCGRALGDLASAGSLHRGLRDVLAHHVIFHWNRFGLATTAQAVLAHTAATTILDAHHDGFPSVGR